MAHKKEKKKNQVLMNKIEGLSNGLVMGLNTDDWFIHTWHSKGEGVG